MKLSIVIICWNDLKVIKDALRTIFEQTTKTAFEIIISDNGSTDGSIDYIRENFADQRVRIVENGENLGFARGNNAGIAIAGGEYVLVLNPDTLILNGGLDKWIEFADAHPEAGAFGAKVLNADGSFQHPARPFPTLRRAWIAALNLGWLGRYWKGFVANYYAGWDGTEEREIDWQSGCCVMFRRRVLQEVGVFDPQFFYHFEEVDLCHRVRQAGYSILYTPHVGITHLGGQSVSRERIRFLIETYRNRYRYFYKYYGLKGVRECRRVAMVHNRLRLAGYQFLAMFRRSENNAVRIEAFQAAYTWNKQLDPDKFIESGIEPDSKYKPLVPAPQLIKTDGRTE